MMMPRSGARRTRATVSHRTLLPFDDREQAAVFLADELTDYRDANALVLAIPRGAVPMGRVIADRLHSQLDVILVRKLGAPFNPEFAVGAVEESGWTYVSPDAARAGAGAEYLHDEEARQRALIAERRQRYRHGKPPVSLLDRTVIVVDDGLATGATMIAALHAARRQQPARIVCAVPVASHEALAAVEPLCDRVVCLASPSDFGGVGQFYVDFRQVSDEEVAAALDSAPPPG
jgi:predicted phosphoribosyltransferase